MVQRQLDSFMHDLRKLEEEAVLLEGQLLEQGLGRKQQLPFNFSSYVARVPLEAAMRALSEVRGLGGEAAR